MSIGIHYVVQCEHSFSDEDKARLREHSQTWSAQLSGSAEPYDVSGLLTQPKFHGVTRVTTDARGAEDYVVLVRALLTLERTFPQTRVLVSDDAYLTVPIRPRDLDLERFAFELSSAWQASEGDGPLAGEDDLENAVDAAAADARRAQLQTLQPLLERARADFEIWKRAQKK